VTDQPGDFGTLEILEGGHIRGVGAKWIEMSPNVNALRVHRDAAKSGISVAPGQIFSAQNEFTNCLRLNFGQAWTPGVESALRTVGKIVSLASRAR
jgi:DNA-binding transcriptional MocR family regulator